MQRDDSGDKPCYWLKCPECAGMRGVSVDSPELKKEVASFCAQGIRDGLSVERCTVSDVRDRRDPWCECRRLKFANTTKRERNTGASDE